jgi:hypothetical protein
MRGLAECLGARRGIKEGDNNIKNNWLDKSLRLLSVEETGTSQERKKIEMTD